MAKNTEALTFSFSPPVIYADLIETPLPGAPLRYEQRTTHLSGSNVRTKPKAEIWSHF